MHLLALFQWLSRSPVGIYMQRSTWTFAVVETIHLLALALLGGSVLVISLRTLGLLRGVAARRLATELLPVVISSLVAIIVTGILMVSEEALKCYYSPAFRAKMVALAIAILLAVPLLGVQAIRQYDRSPWWLKIGAVLSLLSWFSVGVAGRAIGFI
jgi:hypothetical protein